VRVFEPQGFRRVLRIDAGEFANADAEWVWVVVDGSEKFV
jgi:hypothetical protein